MTTSKHLKQLVRARMEATGEDDTQASEKVRKALTEITLDDPLTLDVHGKHGQSVTFTRDGTHLLSGGQDARIAVTNARSGEQVGELLGHEKVVNALAIHPDGRRLVSVSSDRTVRMWDLDSHRQTAVLQGHKDAVVALALTPSGDRAITGGYDGRIRIWNLEDGACVAEHRSPLKRVAAIAVTADGTHSLESGQGPQVVVRDREGEVVTDLDTGSAGVVGLAVAPDGGLLATAGYEGTIGLWSCDSWEPVRDLPAGDRVNAVAVSRGGHLLAAAAAGKVVIWSHLHEDPVASYRLPIKGVYDLAFSADTRRLAQTGADGKVRIFTLR